jgi:hypothetical protein
MDNRVPILQRLVLSFLVGLNFVRINEVSHVYRCFIILVLLRKAKC